MRIQRQSFLGWTGVLISTVFMLLASGLTLYPQITSENILTALRLSSLTTAIPFLLVFVTKPLTVTTDELGQWLRNNRSYLWLALTISHLIHLYQIILYYQLGETCSLTTWLVTAPLWIIMVLFSVTELLRPEIFDYLYQAHAPRRLNILYRLGLWYIWLVFTLAFGLGAAEQHIPFYNIPAFMLFVAGAIFNGIMWWRKKILA